MGTASASKNTILPAPENHFCSSERQQRDIKDGKCYAI